MIEMHPDDEPRTWEIHAYRSPWDGKELCPCGAPAYQRIQVMDLAWLRQHPNGPVPRCDKHAWCPLPDSRIKPEPVTTHDT